LLAIGIGVWSLMTGAFGLTRIFAVMLLSRIGVSVGEAVMTPSAYSLLGDYFPPHRLGLAVGLFSMGGYLGSGLALILGSAALALLPAQDMRAPLIGTVHPWQAIFLALAPIGLVVALWIATLCEPVRRDSEAAGVPDRRAMTAYFRSTWRPLLGVNLSVGLTMMAAYGLLAWTPALITRRYGLPPTQAGWRLGIVLILASCSGTLLAGVIGDRLRAHGMAAGRLIVMSVALAAALPFAAIAPRSSSVGWLLAGLAPLLFFLSAAVGCGPALLQEITPNRLRGVQHSVAVLAANLLGLGLGPTIVALATEHVFGGPSSVGVSLSWILPLCLIGAFGASIVVRSSYARSPQATS
jgi:MFS family permease